VGPNGSGKSNIVDAVKWILGEQSAKSLRGGEMADVIFNGSSTRRSLGLAEVVMTFDNSKRILNSESEEVQITRRVYRDGTGEYLINQQISRLKDIKDLFLGSGAGTSAYCIIEQGRVDALLQASNTDRRTIFEEAAGISRFKQKKIETLRKLDHVEQNLEQLRLIRGEVDKQYRKLSIEASRAQKQIEYTDRIKYLHLGLNWREYQTLFQDTTLKSTIIQRMRDGFDSSQQQLLESEREANTLDRQLAEWEQSLTDQQSNWQRQSNQLLAWEADQQHDYSKREQLLDEMDRSTRKRRELHFHLRLVEQSVLDSQKLIDEIERQRQEHERKIESSKKEQRQLDHRFETLQKDSETNRLKHFDLLRQQSIANTHAETARQLSERRTYEREQKRRRREQREIELISIDRVVSNLSQTDADLQSKLSNLKESLEESIQGRESLKRLAVHLSQELSDLSVERSNLKGRIETLEQLERSQEGLTSGVREVVKWIESDAPQAKLIYGLTADLLNVPREIAPLVDLVLGEKSQSFIVQHSDPIDTLLKQQSRKWSGRVSFLPYRDLPPLSEGGDTVTMDRWITCTHQDLAGLPGQLLGNVLVVPDIDAVNKARSELGSEFRLVTRQGELFEPDGTRTVGSNHLEGGIVSRKSELRDLRAEATRLDQQMLVTEGRLTDLQNRIQALQIPIDSLEQEIRMMTDRVGDLQSQMNQHQVNRTRVEDELSLLDAEMKLIHDDIERIDREQQLHLENSNQYAAEAKKVEQLLDSISNQVREIEVSRERLHQESTQTKISIAQLTERSQAATEKHTQLQADSTRGHEEFERTERHRMILQHRGQELDLQLLRRSAASAELVLQKEVAESVIRELIACRTDAQQRRSILVEQLQHARSESQQQLGELHDIELKLRDQQNSMQSISGRILTDYQLDLSQITRAHLDALVAQGGEWFAFDDPDLEIEPIRRELSDLHKRLTALGRNINFDAIDEFREIEKRATELKTQHDDLVSAQKSLLEIIEKINTESRTLFSSTFESVRTEFKDLFRKLFAGGQADVVLEQPDAPLESGIEIMARPPGKELRSISLMSGGEKTLTAVALLLAIFRSKPSPFCLLDEVDAALDEANTARLASVIREFLNTSQFIIITHKKRTMAAADVLYGVTMQESGVSKQVSIRFEDWPDDEPFFEKAA
jgi:chromosome segregation protein